jgi:hypothetical protein
MKTTLLEVKDAGMPHAWTPLLFLISLQIFGAGQTSAEFEFRVIEAAAQVADII